MAEIEEAIKLKRAEIARLRDEIEVLERAASLLALREEVQREPQGGGRRLRKVSSRRGRISPRSSVGMAIAILRERDSELHADEIIEQMKKRGKIAKKYSLVSSMAKLAKRGLVFYRAKQPNTFGLLEREGLRAPGHPQERSGGEVRQSR